MSWKYNEVEYTEEILQAMSDDELLDLRNKLAQEMGVPVLNKFKDHAQAVEATTNALNKHVGKAKPPRKTAAGRKPREFNGPVKCAEPNPIKRPTRSMFRTIKKVQEHPGVGYRVRRWANYKDGMTLLECHEGDDMTPADVGFYVKAGLMELVEPTDAEYEAGLERWYAARGLKSPEVTRKEREEAAAAVRQERAKAAEAAAAEKLKKANKTKEQVRADIAKKAAQAA